MPETTESGVRIKDGTPRIYVRDEVGARLSVSRREDGAYLALPTDGPDDTAFTEFGTAANLISVLNLRHDDAEAVRRFAGPSDIARATAIVLLVLVGILIGASL